MTLTDRLHCPDCQGRLSLASSEELRCTTCDRTIPIRDGIVDFASRRSPPGADRYRGVTREGLLGSGLPARIKAAAGGRWPGTMGDTLEFGCGLGPMTRAIVTEETFRSLLVVDSDLARLQTCQTGIADLDLKADTPRPVSFVALDGGLAVIRDAVADTVIGTNVLSGIGDTRAFLTLVLRALRIGGRAAFVVPNRRYHQAVCQAIAEALTQHYARHGTWPEGSRAALTLMEQIRLLLVHHDDQALLDGLEEKHLFDSDALEELGREIGFATAEVIPLDPDPAGGDTIIRLCQDAGASDDLAREFGPLAASVGRPLLSLLTPQDASAFSLLWLTKATGPTVRIYSGRPATPPVVFAGPDAAVGGAMPRWSVELLGRHAPDGVVVTVGGWCLGNTDVLWVRVVLDGVARQTPVWRQRPDVHEVLNRARIYHSLNALCSGLDGDLLFPGVYPGNDGCTLHVEIILSGGLVVTGPAPERLTMDQSMVIAH
jgi:hypothetical protein